MNTPATRFELSTEVQEWLKTNADKEFEMPSGAGSLTGQNILDMLSSGGPHVDGDFEPEEIVACVTDSFNKTHKKEEGEEDELD